MGRESRERGNPVEGCIVRKVAQKITRNVSIRGQLSRCPSLPNREKTRGTMTRATKMIGRLNVRSVGARACKRGVETERELAYRDNSSALTSPHPPRPTPQLSAFLSSSRTAWRGGRFFGFFEKKPVFQGDYFGGNSFLARYCSRSCFATRFERKRGEIPWRSLTQQTFPLLSCRTN